MLMNTQTLVVDIDDTICTPLHGRAESEVKYGMANPNRPMIASLQKAKQKLELKSI